MSSIIRFINGMDIGSRRYRPNQVAVVEPSIGRQLIQQGHAVAITVTRADATATPGNATLNVTSGRASIPAGQSSVVITNSTVNPSSEIFLQPRANDATAVRLAVTATGNGAFTVTANANATAALPFSFLVENT